MCVGRWRGPAVSRSSGPVTPVSTSRLSTPARVAASMSVSSRSPTISGRRAPVRRIDSRWSGGSGLPAITGSTPVAVAMTRLMAPFPGYSPRPVGIVVSPLAATNQAPCRTASAPSQSSP